jgi:hypothetical protein
MYNMVPVRRTVLPACYGSTVPITVEFRYGRLLLYILNVKNSTVVPGRR